MFQKENKHHEIKEAETVIGPSIKVKGNFHGQGDMIIEGIVEGSVKTNSFLLVKNKAKITASVEAKAAKIDGEVVGNIRISGYLELGATAKIIGDIEVGEISIEKGAVLNGKCSMIKDKDKIQKENVEHK